MSLATTPAAPPYVPLRERLCEAAARLLTSEGWGRVTMARLAQEVGVSRQTVYNEIGTKKDLAEALVMRELDLFLRGVTMSFDEHPDDLVAALRTAVRRVLKYAADNALLHAVVSANHGADTELLPLLTTNSASLLDGAKQVIGGRVAAYDVPLSAAELDVCVEMIIRIVLSQVMQPGGDPERVSADIGWVVARILR